MTLTVPTNGQVTADAQVTAPVGDQTKESVSATATGLDPNNTHAVIVGVLNWEQESLTSYAKDDRQDVALFRQLQNMGVPAENMTLLLDEQATRQAIHQAVTKTAAKAKPDSTLIIYYAGHGLNSESGGVFACYDIRTAAAQQTGWVLSDLEKQVRENFRGGQVLLLADCCFSGSLAVTTRKLNQSGIKAASLTSASAANVSTNNWTYTVSLIDLLKGQPFADANGDDKISLVEAAYEVRKTMLHYESQRNGFSLHGLSRHFVLADQRAETDLDKAKQLNTLFAAAPGDFVLAKHNGSWRSARIVDERPGQFQVQHQEYSARRTEWVNAELIRIKQPIALKPLLPPEPLAAKEARAKATMDGKYSDLLIKIKVESDFGKYGEYHTFGKWNGSSYAGHTNLPSGHWVYVYPNWYIWKNTREPLVFKPKTEPQIEANSAESLQRQIEHSKARAKTRESMVKQYQAILDRTVWEIKNEEEVQKSLQEKLDALK